jgi:hypothetical protein
MQALDSRRELFALWTRNAASRGFCRDRHHFDAWLLLKHDTMESAETFNASGADATQLRGLR